MDFNLAASLYTPEALAAFNRQANSHAILYSGGSFIPVSSTDSMPRNSPVQGSKGRKRIRETSDEHDPYIYGRPAALLNPACSVPQAYGLTDTLTPRIPDSYPIQDPDINTSQLHSASPVSAQSLSAQSYAFQGCLNWVTPVQEFPFSICPGPPLPATTPLTQTSPVNKSSTRAWQMTPTPSADSIASESARFTIPSGVGSPQTQTRTPERNGAQVVLTLSVPTEDAAQTAAPHDTPTARHASMAQTSIAHSPAQAVSCQAASVQASVSQASSNQNHLCPSSQSPISQPQLPLPHRNQSQSARVQPPRGRAGRVLAARNLSHVQLTQSPNPRAQHNQGLINTSPFSPHTSLIHQAPGSFFPQPTPSQTTPTPIHRARDPNEIFSTRDFVLFGQNTFSMPQKFNSFLRTRLSTGVPVNPFSDLVIPWDFYLKHWCPGRSLHQQSNPWSVDFARLEDKSIRSALECIAIIYMNDYQQGRGRYRNKAQTLLTAAVDDLNFLLGKPNLTDNEKEKSISLLIILSTIQAILPWQYPEGVKQPPLPTEPLWLTALRQAEGLLEQIDNFKRRYYNLPPPTPTSLQVSQTILVAAPIILAEMMMKTPAKHMFDAERERARFGWLYHDSAASKINAYHGACGFSRQLLKIITDITRLSGRMKHESQVGLLEAAEALRDRLDFMPGSQFGQEQPNEDSIVGPEEMKEKTGKAWVVMAKIYLQCRVFRLHRMHTTVQNLFQELYSLIASMPTDGDCYTAEAPFLPAFLLAVLAHSSVHQKTAETWLKEAWLLPIRSNARALYQATLRTKKWIHHVGTPGAANMGGNQYPYQRLDWWDDFAERLHRSERKNGGLCFVFW